jgi:hypothetical protein
MENSFAQEGSETQQRRRILSGPRIFHRFEKWLARLVQIAQLTEDEQMDAGIHLRQLSEDEQKDAGIYE